MNIFKSIQKALSNVNPKTYSGLGIVLTWAGAILMIPATLAAKKRLDEKQPETLGGKIATVAPCYIGPVGMLTGGTALEVAGVTKAVTAATNLGAIAVSSTTAANAYCEAVDKYAPKEVKNKINEAVATKIADTPPQGQLSGPTAQQMQDQRLDNGNEIYTFEQPKDICVEEKTSRFFMIPVKELEEIEKRISNELTLTGKYTFDDMFWLFGINPPSFGDDFGWNAEDYYNCNGEVNFKFRIRPVRTREGRPMLSIGYDVEPHKLTEE